MTLKEQCAGETRTHDTDLLRVGDMRSALVTEAPLETT